MKKSASAALYMRLASKHKAQSRLPTAEKIATWSTYTQVAKYWLHNYVTDGNIVDTEGEVSMLLEPPNKKPKQYAEEPFFEVFWCGVVFKNHDINGIFTKGLTKSIRRSVNGYRASLESASLHDLAFHATPLVKLQCEHRHHHATWSV